jgi:hypothetical protein
METVTTKNNRISANRGDTLEILIDGELVGTVTAIQNAQSGEDNRSVQLFNDWTFAAIGIPGAFRSEWVRKNQPAVAAIIDASRFIKADRKWAFHQHVWTIASAASLHTLTLSKITCRRCDQPLSRWS